MKFINELIPFYPDIDNISSQILSVNDFNSLRGKTKEIIDGKMINNKLVGFRAYQIFIQRFFSPYTQYNGLLLAHEMGSGKTCTAFLVICFFLEKTILEKRKKVLVLCHNTLQIENIKRELKEKCAEILFKTTIMTEIEKTSFLYLLSKNVVYYSFSYVENLKHNNFSLIIVDEVHTVHLQKDESAIKKQLLQKGNLYFKMKKFLNNALKNNVKILLMTGTPISNHFSKLFQIMDFILPDELQFDTSDKDTLQMEEEYGIADTKRDEIYFDVVPEGVIIRSDPGRGCIEPSPRAGRRSSG